MTLGVILRAGPNLRFYCPGCEDYHAVWLPESPHPVTKAYCEWNNDIYSPSFSPEMLVNEKPRCRLRILAGVIYYHDGCEHRLAGYSVPMFVPVL